LSIEGGSAWGQARNRDRGYELHYARARGSRGSWAHQDRPFASYQKVQAAHGLVREQFSESDQAMRRRVRKFFSSFHWSSGLDNMEQRKKAGNWRARGDETPGKCPHEMKRMFAICRDGWSSSILFGTRVALGSYPEGVTYQSPEKGRVLAHPGNRGNTVCPTPKGLHQGPALQRSNPFGAPSGVEPQLSPQPRVREYATLGFET
jgi:hypothetical protein